MTNDIKVLSIYLTNFRYRYLSRRKVAGFSEKGGMKVGVSLAQTPTFLSLKSDLRQTIGYQIDMKY